MYQQFLFVMQNFLSQTNEMSGVFDKLENLGKEFTACQLDAKMTISDISIVDMLSRIKNISVGVDSIVRIFFVFFSH